MVQLRNDPKHFMADCSNSRTDFPDTQMAARLEAKNEELVELVVQMGGRHKSLHGIMEHFEVYYSG